MSQGMMGVKSPRMMGRRERGEGRKQREKGGHTGSARTWLRRALRLGGALVAAASDLLGEGLEAEKKEESGVVMTTSTYYRCRERIDMIREGAMRI